MDIFLLKGFSLFIYLFKAAWGSSFAALGLSLIVEGRGYSLVGVHGLLITVASLVVEHRCWGTQSSVVVADGLSCSEARGIFPDWGSNLWSPTLAGVFLTTGPPGKSHNSFLYVSHFRSPDSQVR